MGRNYAFEHAQHRIPPGSIEPHSKPTLHLKVDRFDPTLMPAKETKFRFTHRHDNLYYAKPDLLRLSPINFPRH